MGGVGGEVTPLKGTLTAHVRNTLTGYTSQRYSDYTCQKNPVRLHISGVLYACQKYTGYTSLSTLTAHVKRTQSGYTSQGYSWKRQSSSFELFLSVMASRG